MNRCVVCLSMGLLALTVLSGCGGDTPPKAEPAVPQTSSPSNETKPAAAATAAEKPAAAKSDPLKDVVPPGPLVPYFNPLTEAEISDGWISAAWLCKQAKSRWSASGKLA